MLPYNRLPPGRYRTGNRTRHVGLSLIGDFKRYLQGVANNISRARCARSSCTTYHYPRCQGWFISRSLNYRVSCLNSFPQAVTMLRETKVRSDSRLEIYEDWSPISSGFEEESRHLNPARGTYTGCLEIYDLKNGGPQTSLRLRRRANKFQIVSTLKAVTSVSFLFHPKKKSILQYIRKFWTWSPKRPMRGCVDNYRRKLGRRIMWNVTSWRSTAYLL